MPDDDRQGKDAPEDDLEAEIAELEGKLREAVGGQPLSEADEERLEELVDKLESEQKLEELFEKQDKGIERLEALVQQVETHREEVGLDEDMESRLRRIEEMAQTARTRRGTGLSSPEKSREMKSDREAARGLGLGLSVAYTIIGLPMFGLAVGWLLDKNTNSNIFKPAFVVGGAALGIVIAIVMLNREQNRK